MSVILPIYRYAQRQYLEDFMYFGKVRFAHARTFNDISLTAAQFDDEHHRIYTLDPSVHVLDIYGTDGKTHHFETVASTSAPRLAPGTSHENCPPRRPRIVPAPASPPSVLIPGA